MGKRRLKQVDGGPVFEKIPARPPSMKSLGRKKPGAARAARRRKDWAAVEKGRPSDGVE